jgi:Tol biopolymer transport system component
VIRQIGRVEPETSVIETHQLTEEPDNYDPDWSPDGSAIVFGSNRNGRQDIYIMSADGERERPLTDDTFDDFAPEWRPARP